MAPTEENWAPLAFNLVTPLKVSGAKFSADAGKDRAAGVKRIDLCLGTSATQGRDRLSVHRTATEKSWLQRVQHL